MNSLKKQQLEEQILDLYQRFYEVRIFYNIIFNTGEIKLLGEAKFLNIKRVFSSRQQKAKSQKIYRS
ncbi:DUF6155 family protein [Gillisia limnaea]|uniref:DUF6155 family protein n=1 Tax=Gillisia limnaea TaxID=195907 RepID=UPI0002E2C596|nr:DUF6155 family protein [Gillisia limnaea]